MKNRLIIQPVLWTLLAGVALGVLGFGLAGRGAPLSTSTLANPVQVRPVGYLDSSKLDSLISLKAIDDATTKLADYALPAVVYVHTSSPTRTDPSQPHSLFAEQPEEGAGSGVIIRPDGYILTNDHVVDGFDKVQVTLKDGQTFTGEVRRAPIGDLALVHIDAKNLPSLAFADSDLVKPGQLAMAIGAPFNLPFSVTLGHVSAVGRANRIADDRTGAERDYTSLIQTDAAINRGNSGGPLIDMNGNIIGINTTIYSPSGGSSGVGFAIPANEARIIADQLIAGKQVKRSAMGFFPSEIPGYLKGSLKANSGAYIQEVKSDGPAAIAGLQKGDVIVRVGSTPISDEADLRNSMLQYAPGSTVDVEYLRGGADKVTKIKLIDMASLQQNTPDAANTPGGSNRMPNEDELRKFFESPDNAVPSLPDHTQRFFHSTPQDNGNHPDRKVGQPAHLGVQVGELNAQTRAQFHVPSDVNGALVVDVEPGSVADSLNIQPGTVVTRLGVTPIKSANDLVVAMKSVKWGDTQRIEFASYGDGSVVTESLDAHFR
jgi:serine protease Do